MSPSIVLASVFYEWIQLQSRAMMSRLTYSQQVVDGNEKLANDIPLYQREEDLFNLFALALTIGIWEQLEEIGKIAF